MSREFVNWSGAYRCQPAQVFSVRNSAEARAALLAVARAGKRVRVMGAGNSPGDIAMSDDGLILTDQMNRVLEIDRATGRVRVQGGARLRDIIAAVRPAGLAFPVLGSTDDHFIAGAAATGTHGTGLGYPGLPGLIEQVQLVTPAGDIIEASATENTDIWNAARCGLGSLGVITELTLKLVPLFDLEVTEGPAALDTVLDGLPERLQDDHYRFWFLPHVDWVWEWRGHRVPPAPRPAVPFSLKRWWTERVVGYHLFETLLLAGQKQPAIIPALNRWYARRFLARPRSGGGDSVSMFTFDCLFSQHVNEWAVPVEHTAEALRALKALIERSGWSVHLPIEVRFTAPDDVWLSPSYGRASCWIGVIAYRPYGREGNHHPYFAAFESLMASFGGRPHWGKRFTPGAAELAPRYPRWDDFQAVRKRLDPQGIMANAFTDRVLGRSL